jgi:hypothetical protein
MVVGAILALLLIAALIAFEPVKRWFVVERAREHGVELSLGDVDLSWDGIVLHDFSFVLVGVDGIRAEVGRLELTLDDGEPQRVDIDGVKADARGSATELMLALTSWAKEHPALLRLPAKGTKIDVRWRPDPAGDVWLAIDDATISPSDDGGRLEADNVEVVGFDLGRVGAVWRGDAAKVDIGFGTDSLDDAPVRAVVRHALEQPEATMTLRPVPLETLAGPLAFLLPIRGVIASGNAKLRWIEPGIDAPIEGHIDAKFVGYRPPVPLEVQQFVFGDTTEVSTDIALDRPRKNIRMNAIEVKHGAFRLKGDGKIERGAKHARAKLKLSGSLSCAQLAKAAALGRIGGPAGSIIGTVAGRVVVGSVGVTIGVDASTANLAGAKITRSIGVGCGIMPGKILPKLPELPELPELLKLPKLPKLPAIPGLPEFPKGD